MGIAPHPAPGHRLIPKRKPADPVGLFQACAERIALKQIFATLTPEKENHLQGELLKGELKAVVL